MKKLAISTGIVLLLLVAAVALLPFLVSLDAYRDFVVSQAEEYLGRPLSVGEMRLALWRGAGIELRDVRMGNAAGFSATDALRLKRLHLGFKPLPLLRGIVTLQSVLIERLVLLIEIAPDGQTNFSDLLRQLSAASSQNPRSAAVLPAAGRVLTFADPSPQSSFLSSVTFEKLRLRNATLVLRQSAHSWAPTLERQVRRIDLTAGPFAFGATLPVTLAALLGSRGSQNLRLQGTLKGLTPDFALAPLVVDGTLKLEKLPLPWLAGMLGKPLPVSAGLLTLSTKFEGSVARRFRLRGSMRAEDLAGSLGASGVQFPRSVGLTYDLQYLVPEQRLRLEPSTLSLDSQRLSLRGSVERLGSAPRLDLAMKGESIVVERLLAENPSFARMVQGFLEVQGAARVAASLQGELHAWAGRAEVDLQAAELRSGSILSKRHGQPARLAVQVSGGGGRVQIQELALALPPLAVRAQGSLQPAHWALRGTAAAGEPGRGKSGAVLEELVALLPFLKAVLPPGLSLDGPLAFRFGLQGKPSQLKLSATFDGTPASVRYKEVLHKPAGLPAAISMEGEVGADSLSLAPLRVAFGAFEMEGSGRLENFASPFLKLTLRSNRLEVMRLTPMLPGLGDRHLTGAVHLRLSAQGPLDAAAWGTEAPQLDGRLELLGIGPLEESRALLHGFGLTLPPHLRLAGKLSGNLSAATQPSGLQVRSDLDLRDAALSYAELFAKPAGLAGGLRFAGALKGPDLAVEALRLDLGAAEVEGKGVVRNLGNPELDLSFTVTLRPPAARPPSPPPSPLKKSALSGRGTLKARLQGPLNDLSRLRGSGRLEAPELIVSGGRFQEVNGAVALAEGILELRPFTFRAFGGRQEGEVSLRLTEAEPQVRLRTEVADMRLGEVLRSMTSLGELLTGTMSGRFSGAGRGAEVERLLATLNGAGQISVRDGELTRLNVLEQAAKLAQALGLKSGPQASGGTPFRELSTPIQVQEGRVITPAVVLRSRDLDAAASGSFAFDLTGQYEIDVLLSAELSRRFGGKLTRALRNQQGRLSLPLRISGDLTRPTIRPGEKLAEALASAIASSILGGGSEGSISAPAAESVSKLVGSLLGGSSKRSQERAAAPAAAPEEAPRAEPPPSEARRAATVEPPALAIAASPTRLRRGVRLDLTLSITPGATPRPVDGYVLIELPNQQRLFIGSDGRLSEQPVALRARFQPRSFSGSIFSHTISQEPPGTYNVYAVLVEPGGDPLRQGDWVSPLATASFVVE